MKIEIRNIYTNTVIVSGDYESMKDCLEKNRGANLAQVNLADADLADAKLEGAYLAWADLEGASLEGASLKGAYLSGMEGYSQSREVFAEVVRRQETDAFTETEWSVIGQIIIHDLCWDSIEKRFAPLIPHLCDVLAQKGFGEWQRYWKEHMEGKESEA